jgi:aminomethyltransferase
MSLKKTVYFNDHIKANARMVDFGGWEMPIQFEGLLKEHEAVRTSVGLFDVSHMGEVWIEGKDALKVVRYLVTNDVCIEDGQAQYTCLCNHQGGILDDLIVYRFNQEKFLLCINASNREKDFLWMEENNPFQDTVDVTQASDDFAQVAIQGRNAERTLQKLTETQLSSLGYYHFVVATVSGVENCIIARTGYTGEDGFEVFIPIDNADSMWSEVLNAGKEFAIKPIGLGARDTLRLEARMNLYGNDMSEEYKPHEAGIFWTVKASKSSFIGKDAILKHKSENWTKRLVGLVVDKRIPRSHCAIIHNEQIVGEVTSGTRSPSLGKGIALARVPRSLSRLGTKLEVDIRGKRATATVVKGPFYTRDY